MSIYIFLYFAVPAIYGSGIFYIRLGRRLARWGKTWTR